jgi:PhoH-like ATPase
MAKSKNIFVLDTCVLLHDPNCIYKFEEHDIYIPLACIDDLDELKTKKENVGYAAREVFRQLDKYDIQQLTEGLIINEAGGKLYLYNSEAPLQRGEKPSITRVNSDNAIIDAAMSLKAKYPKKKVIIVSKDTGLRVRAISWGCLAENYKNDLLDVKKLYDGYKFVDVESLDDWNYLNKRLDCNIEKLHCKDQLKDINPNEFICFRYGNQSVFAWYKNREVVFLDEKKKKDAYMGIAPKNMEQRFAIEALADENIPLVCLSGPAGSGKSILVLAVALEKINQGVYDRIIVMKPLVPVGGKEIGFLPGSKFEKISAWLGPVKDNLLQLTNFSEYGTSKKNDKFGGLNFEDMIEDGLIEAEAMTFIQGRSIPNSVIMMDECQNLTPKEVRMVVERCGKGSKVVLLGDLSQVENPYLDQESCGLSHAINGSKTHEIAACIALNKVERSMLSAAASEIFNVKK